MVNIQELTKFASHSVPSREVSLLVVSDPADLEPTEQILQKLAFSLALEPTLLADCIEKGNNSYIILNDDNAKELYDLTVEYPTGQISFSNKKTLEKKWIRPNYEQAGVIILSTLSTLTNMEERGLVFRSIAGLAYNN
jgi:hypothetical protein